eukprot:2812756-Pyramimonas_sp.AAC.1
MVTAGDCALLKGALCQAALRRPGADGALPVGLRLEGRLVQVRVWGVPPPAMAPNNKHQSS